MRAHFYFRMSSDTTCNIRISTCVFRTLLLLEATVLVESVEQICIRTKFTRRSIVN